jgi:hypothetical protein
VSDVFDLVEGARPDVDPIPPDDRRRFREELFHDGRRTPDATAEAAVVVPWQTRHRSRQLVIFVALLLIGGVVTLYVLRDEESHDSTAAVATAPTTRPEAEETSGSAPAFEFTPLLLQSAPAGYRLHWARYEGNLPADTVGLARYVGPADEPEIAIRLRAEPGAYSGELEEDTQTWQVEQRRAAADPASGLCIDSTCSVNIQWNDITAVSVSWVNWDGTSLNAEVTHERLVEYAQSLTPQPGRWKPGSIDPADPTWELPDPDNAPLLLPGNDDSVISAEHQPPWPGSSSVSVRAADDTIITMREGDGGATSFEQDDLVRQGSVSLVPPANRGADPLQYDLEVRCGFAQVADEPGRRVLRTTMKRLFDSMTVDRGEITLQLREDWSRVAAGDHAGIYTFVATAEVGGKNREITLRQSPGGTVSDLLYGRGPFTQVDFAGGPAWTDDAADRTVVIGRRADSPFEISARDVTVEQLENFLERLRPGTVEDWTARWGSTTAPGLETTCPQQPYFVIREGG